jgi:transposase
MEKKILKQLISEGKSQRQIANELNSSQSNIRYWLRVYDLSTLNQPYNKKFSESDNKNTKICISCGEEKYLSDYRQSVGDRLQSYCKVCQNKYTIQRRKIIKGKCVEYKGGSCEVCGYDKCKEALHFHHINPEDKSFGIAANGVNHSWEKIKKELDKCIMVCANCHAEIHSGFVEL